MVMIAGLVIGLLLGILLIYRGADGFLLPALLVLGVGGLSVAVTWDHVTQYRRLQAANAAFADRTVAVAVPSPVVGRPPVDAVILSPMEVPPRGGAAPEPAR